MRFSGIDRHRALLFGGAASAVALAVVSFVVIIGMLHRDTGPLPARKFTWQTVSDAKWQYNVQIPDEFHNTVDDKANSTSTWVSRDGLAQVTIWSARTSKGFSPTNALQKCQAAARTSGAQVQFTFATDQFYVCRGVGKGGTSTFYERGVIGASRGYYMRWQYDDNARLLYGPAVDHAVDTFTPGPLGVISKGA